MFHLAYWCYCSSINYSKDIERRDIDDKVLAKGKNFDGKVGDKIETVMEITKVIFSKQVWCRNFKWYYR